MSGRKTTTARKAERPSYENKAVVPAASVKVRVIKAHDGLAEGSVWVKPRAIAEEMANIGYWEII